MHHWDRDTLGRLQRISAPVEQGYEVSVHSDEMDPLPEEQQSQQGTPVNPTAYRSMRDHIHPPRVCAPSCIITPVEDVAVRPYLVPLLPTFHDMENENPYTHIRDFEEVCITFKEGTIDMDLLKLKAFPLTLKDKAKIWLNSLRPRTIRSWAELQAEFLKKFFSAHKTNNLKRQIYKGWDEPNPKEVEKMRPSAHKRGGIYALSEDMEMEEKISTLARKVEELEGKRLHEVQTVTENPAHANPCINFNPLPS